MASVLTQGTSAAHAECGPLQLVTQMQMERPYERAVIIPVTINGVQRRFLFDTGGALTQISPAVAEEGHLRTIDSSVKIFDASGNISNKMAIVDAFAVGPIKGSNLRLQVAPVAGRADGVLTQSLFPHLDIDMDFGPGRFALFLDNHCPGRVVYWKTDVLAVVPVTFRDNHINLPVSVEGRTLSAILDTGATDTFMDMDFARRAYGLTPDSPGMVLDGHANDDPDLPVYRHVFSTLSFDGVSVANAAVHIIPNRTTSKDRDNDARTGSHVQRVDDDLAHPDLTLGMNILHKLHVYIATGEKKVYITPAGAPDSPSPLGASQQ